MAHDAQSRDARAQGGSRSDALQEARRHAPRQWIYENLTPWRIHACFTRSGELVPRSRGEERGSEERASDERPCDDCVVRVLSIPALGEVKVPREDALLLNTLDMRRLGQIEVRPAPSELLTNLPRAIVIFGWIAVTLLFGGWALFAGGASSLPWAAVIAAYVAVPVAALVVAAVREVQLYERFSRYRASVSEAAPMSSNGHGPRMAMANAEAPRKSLEGIERGSRIRAFVDGVPRHVAEVAILVGAIVVSVIGLGVAIHQTTQLNEVMPIDYGAIFRLDDPFAEVSDVAKNSPAFWQLLAGHVAQWVLVSVAAFAPIAMYFQFDRQRLASVERRWVQEVFRLDPTVRTVPDIRAKYGSQIESSFGNLTPDSSLTLRRGRRSPVIVATILIAVGWFLVISTTDVPDLVEVPTAEVGAVTTGGADGTELVWSTDLPAAAEQPGTVVDSSFPVSSFFRPNLTLVGYAFLGSYVFALFHVLRGYQRRDLHPKTYNTIVVRILAAYALALVASVVYAGPSSEVFMFFVGFTPQSALVWLKEKLSQNDGLWGIVPLHEPAPLTDLEGIDLYDRTRLDEEGISNIQNLAHADIVDLMSSTRIAAAQLVDWTDQAILYLRVGGDAMARHRKDVKRRSGEQGDSHLDHLPDVRCNLSHLRSYGIRTATDLVQTYEQALRRGRDRAERDFPGVDHELVHAQAGRGGAPGVEGSDRSEVRRFLDRVEQYEAAEVGALRKALDLPDAPRRGSVHTIQTIIDTLPDEEWFMQVRNWRNPEFGAVDAWYSYLDGHDWTLIRSTEIPPRVEEAKRPLVSVAMAAGGHDHTADVAEEAPAVDDAGRDETEPAVAAVIEATEPAVAEAVGTTEPAVADGLEVTEPAGPAVANGVEVIQQVAGGNGVEPSVPAPSA